MELTVMTKYQALQHFWSSFGIPAYESSTVPDTESRGDFYITYEAVTDSLDNAVPMSASIWKLNTTSWKDVSEVAERISDALIQVKTIPLDTGYLYITRGRPFAQKMSDEDETVRRIYINIMAEYLAP
jgi:hypothetical protein